jgi:hypothetical protein
MADEPKPLTEAMLQTMIETMFRDEAAGIRMVVANTKPHPIRMVGPKPPFL